MVIHGPTAIGKTALAIHLAQMLQTEVLSTDARQFYREMSIGTAKPTQQELAVVKHHFIDNKSIHDLYSAGDFEKDALACLDALFEKVEIAIAIGGSGLYIKALCEGLHEMPDADLNLRNNLIQLFEIEGIVALQNQLKQLNPERWESIDQNNPQRLMRAIELANQNGFLSIQKRTRDFRIVKIGLDMNREDLYKRINLRVDQMLEQGLLEEAKSVFPYKHLNALQTVGYNELFDYFDGKISLDRAIELIKQHTRNFAKRQMTWFRKDPEINWFNPENIGVVEDWVQANV